MVGEGGIGRGIEIVGFVCRKVGGLWGEGGIGRGDRDRWVLCVGRLEGGWGGGGGCLEIGIPLRIYLRKADRNVPAESHFIPFPFASIFASSFGPRIQKREFGNRFEFYPNSCQIYEFTCTV